MHITIDRFTCNRCDTEVETQRRTQPDGWTRLTLTAPPLANPVEVDGRLDIHLCPECTEDIETAIRKTP